MGVTLLEMMTIMSLGGYTDCLMPRNKKALYASTFPTGEL